MYIPCWTIESEALFKKYKESGDPDTGKNLMTSLKEEDASNGLTKWQHSISHTRADEHGAYYES